MSGGVATKPGTIKLGTKDNLVKNTGRREGKGKGRGGEGMEEKGGPVRGGNVEFHH